MHDTSLLATITAAFGVAFVAGLLATQLRLPAIVGYLLAGVVIGPFTPGYVANVALAPQLAEIGVILLMFGVGAHFSLPDLLSVRRVAVPGAIGQSAGATLLTATVAWLWGWDVSEGVILGLAVSVASTVVLLRALLEAGLLSSDAGKVAVGWLIVEDLFTVVVLVLLPAVADQVDAVTAGSGFDPATLAVELLTTFLKLSALLVLMAVVGTRLVPRVLRLVERTGSRELFTLGVLAIALGVAFAAAEVFDVSFALGAFLAGVVVGASEFGHRAAEDAVPLRDAFAVLFFVSVGMLFDPAFLTDSPVEVVSLLVIVLAAKPALAFGLMLVARRPRSDALVVAASLGQIGEFSFILAELARSLDLLPESAYSLVIAGALLSITVNPFLFRAIRPLVRIGSTVSTPPVRAATN